MNPKLTTKEFIYRAKLTHKNKYDYSKTIYIKSTIKVIIICSVHGEFLQVPFSHINGCGCPLCKKITIGNKLRKSTKDFIAQAKKVHGNKFHYNKVQYKKCTTPIILYCTKHKLEFTQSPEVHLSGGECPKCRYEKTAKAMAKTTENFIQEAKKIHGNLFDYSKAQYKNRNTKLIIICKKHGEFKQQPAEHLNAKQGCPICGGKLPKTTKQFIAEAIEIHGTKYDYSKTNYINTNTKVIIICKKHGEFKQLPCNHLSKSYGCPKCGATLSKKEEEIKKWVKSLGVKAEKGIGVIPPNEIDIFLPDFNLGIEYNGLYWHNSRTKSKNYHINKTILCEEKNIHLMQFWDFEWEYKQDIVKSIIKNALHIPEKRIYARNTILDKNISTKEAKLFCAENHLHGFRGGNQKVGLRYKNKLVALMITSYTGEMVRFVITKYTQILGGFSKLLKYSDVKYSFVDRRVFTGKGYIQNGFILDRITDPNYFYVDGGMYLGTRQQFQKYKLRKKLKLFDPAKSEIQNMLNNGYHQVYDCGNFVFLRSLPNKNPCPIKGKGSVLHH